MLLYASLLSKLTNWLVLLAPKWQLLFSVQLLVNIGIISLLKLTAGVGLLLLVQENIGIMLTSMMPMKTIILFLFLIAEHIWNVIGKGIGNKRIYRSLVTCP